MYLDLVRVANRFVNNPKIPILGAYLCRSLRFLFTAISIASHKKPRSLRGLHPSMGILKQ